MDSRYAIIHESSDPVPDDLVTSIVTNRADGDHPTPRKSPQSSSWRRNTKHGTTYASVPIIALDELNHTADGSQSSLPIKDLAGAEPQDLPSVDIGSNTKLQCLLTIIFGAMCSLACIICSIGFWTTNDGWPLTYLPEGLPGEALSFIVNIILTQCLEGLAYVHSISLRWALLKENRLLFNTNIRLFTSSRLSRPNSWYINSISATLLILCYGATSMLVIPRFKLDTGTSYESHLNLIALLALGVALFGQTLLAIWCYYHNLRDIPSWSSNPLNTTVTMIKQQSVQHRKGRCIYSVQIRDPLEARPTLPRTKQPSQWQINTSARQAMVFIWILTGLSIVWFLTIVLVTRSNMIGTINEFPPQSNSTWPSTWHFSLAWNPSANLILQEISIITYFNAVFFSLDYIEKMSFVAALFVGLLFVCAIQGLQTLGLHCAELIVNLSRDEDVWRDLDAQGRFGRKTNVLETPPFLAALTSWKYGMLLIFKSLLHWLLGQSSHSSFDNEEKRVWFTMNYARLFVYIICATIFVSALTFVMFKKPEGPQPATYGHIQTLADVIDDWTLNKNGRFWWGDKGIREEVRHAGMSSREEDLGLIHMDARYAGEDLLLN